LREDSNILKKQIRPNFKSLGPKFGKDMGLIAAAISKFSITDIKEIESNKHYYINDKISIELADVEIGSAEIPGFSVATNNGITVALDVVLSKELKDEGIAREFVNRIQGLRKDNGFSVTDKIEIWIKKNDLITTAIQNNFTYICEETLAKRLNYEETIVSNPTEIKLIDNIVINVSLVKN
jgi:isoleucyl-tRNA synthetase